MCRPVRCGTCGKTTWAGCGLHIEEALAGVPDADRCPGHDDPAPQARSASPASTTDRGVFGR